MPTPRRWRTSSPRTPANSLAGLSLGAALIHAAVIASHFREYWLFGLFFAIVAPLQLLWAYLLTRRDPSRALLVAGGAGNLAIALVWVFSRTLGLPVGPEPWEPETVHFEDVIATLDEVAIATIVALLLRPRGAVSVPGWALSGSWILVGLSVVGAMVGTTAGH